MNSFFTYLNSASAHLKTFNDFFSNRNNYSLPAEKIDYDIYQENLRSLNQVFTKIGAFQEIYSQKNRQMILADLFEYLLLGRAFYSMGTKRGEANEKKEIFIKGVLNLVNLLMCYESLTVVVNRRNKFLDTLSNKLPEIKKEESFNLLRNYQENVGLPNSTAGEIINDYFDKLFPKTAGGLWHELLVYIFVIRNDLGYILPLLLHQKIYSKKDHLVPPDFFVITFDKRIYGIEVGSKKEIQSGSFSLKTAIPTATVDTINSRNSDRCPICKKWINFCPEVIRRFSDFNQDISKSEVRCLTECTIFTPDQIAQGDCKYSKYSRGKIKAPHSEHNYSDNKHYHYNCVLKNVSQEKKEQIIAAKDGTAIKTHIPYYQGLNELFPKIS